MHKDDHCTAVQDKLMPVLKVGREEKGEERHRAETETLFKRWEVGEITLVGVLYCGCTTR